MFKKFNIIISVGIFLALLIGAYIYVSNMKQKKFDRFNSSALNGRIIEIKEYEKVDNFKLNSSKGFYYFNAIPNEKLNRGSFYSRIAEIGDSIYKEKYVDTFYLYKPNGKIYIFPFRKY